ncbi:MAG: sigma-70 family RNA polymerase sigma factor [Candidatus Margulisiibacteriota bacterium]
MIKQDFEQIYMDSKKNVWSLVSRYVFFQQDREDLLQEVFINVHKALSKFRGESSINTWIYKITVNTAINYVNKQNRFKTLKRALSGLRIIEEESLQVSSDINELKPLAKLNPQQRMILLLSDIEEKKLDEIAEMMRLPIGTVKSNLHRAREIVKKEVIENGGL